MKDVFISHSSLDRKIAEEVCNRLEQEELECWISFRTKNLEPGREYIERIREAIDSSKIFIVLLSQNSVLSKQIFQEIALANDRQKFGMKIFPIIIDESLEMDSIYQFAGYVLAGKEYANWNIEESRQELLNQIKMSLSRSETKEVATVLSMIPEKGEIIGREKELQSIFDELQYKNRICLTGMGGIGKTAVLQAFCNSELITKKYKTVVYIPVEKCLIRTIANDAVVCIEKEDLEEIKQTLSSYEYALYKLALLENSVNKDTLVILDNIETDNDPLLDRMCALKCDLIVATRYYSKQFSGFSRIIIEELKSSNTIHNLFELYYGEKLEQSEYDSLDSILVDVHFHTMTVILLAKQMSYLGKRPHDYQNKNQIRLERTSNLTQILSGSMKDDDIAEMYMHLFDLFDATTLTSEEKKVMKTMCILPTEGIQRHFYIQLIGEHLVPVIEKLEKTGWIHNNNDRTIIMLHPLIRDIVMHELEIYMEDPDINVFVDQFIKLISTSWNKTYQENLKFKEMSLSIYYQFPNPSLSKYKEYLVLSKLLWILDYMDIGLEIQNKVKMLFVTEDGARMNSAEEAEAFLQIGFTYQGKGDYSCAAIELENAAKIYGNRYAAALSHLAQAYMMIGEKTIDEIEPSLKESLMIRERYWPGTIFEATSCHLYAKTLSTYGENLELALRLEKKAHSIFSKLQPGGVNVSSTAYILGWLYVQTAVDDEDLEFGIENLEEAKRIRIKHRGNPIHSWMEDVYLKLGLAYEKYKDDQKAKEYFELLLQVRTNKYGEKPATKQMIETYELLQRVYERLGDQDGVKRTKKYLRYV